MVVLMAAKGNPEAGVVVRRIAEICHAADACGFHSSHIASLYGVSSIPMYLPVLYIDVPHD